MHRFPRRTGITLLLATAVAVCGVSRLLAAEPDPEDLRRMAGESVAALGIQTTRPELRRRDSDYAPASGGNGLLLSEETAHVLMWLAVAVAGSVLAITVYQNAHAPAGAATKKASRKKNANAESVRRRMDGDRREGDELAEAGDYAGAMHVLLIRSVEEMRRRLGVPIAASLTSREIHNRIRLEPEARAALGDIIDRVEISWFGGRLPGPEEYARCRASFLALTHALAGG